MSDAGLGQPGVGWVLNRFVLMETGKLRGELSALGAHWNRAAQSADPIDDALGQT